MKRCAVVLVALSLSIPAAVALADIKSYPGKTSLSLSGYRLSGNLSSPLPACEKNRFITIYLVGGDGMLGAAAGATTTDNGYWITGTGFFTPGQTYVARTPAKVLPKQGQHVRKCQAVSKRRTLPPPPTAAPMAHEAPASLAKKGTCGKGKKSMSKPKSCKKAKQRLDILYGQYLGDDVAVVVGKARSGPHAGREYVQIVGGIPMAVTCSDGSTQEIEKGASGWISGKTFSGTESSETSESSTSGSFTSLTTIKGVYRTVSKRFGVICETGSHHFTAKYEG